MVLLETGELLLHKDAATVVKVMGRKVFNILHALPTSPSLSLSDDKLVPIHGTENGEAHSEPETSILCEKHFAIVVHGCRRHSSIEIKLIMDHVSLELDGIFGSDGLGIWMIEFQLVMDLRGMELAGAADSASSDGTSAFHGNTTSVETEMVDVVLLALIRELCHTRLSVTTLLRCGHRNVT